MFTCAYCWSSPCHCSPSSPWKIEEVEREARQHAAFMALSGTDRLKAFRSSIAVSIPEVRTDHMLSLGRSASRKMDEEIARVLCRTT